MTYTSVFHGLVAVPLAGCVLLAALGCNSTKAPAAPATTVRRQVQGALLVTSA
ncbi:MAG TPA: hypothetical protein VFA68_00570 [Terriglobales bacterium]|nr:hypothetical protein [Terriglobales bacterium]